MAAQTDLGSQGVEQADGGGALIRVGKALVEGGDVDKVGQALGLAGGGKVLVPLHVALS